MSHSSQGKLSSHKGFYNITLEPIGANFLESGNGQSIYTFKKTCSGWALEESYAINYDLTNKKSTKSFSLFKSYEDLDSNNFSFEHYENSELNGVSNYSGFIKKNLNNLSGSLIDNEIKNLKFEGEILLPTEHLIKLIDNAIENKVFFSSNVFFGSSKNKLIKYVTSVIGKKKILLTSVFDKKNKEIEVWPIKLAFFDYKQKKSSPQSQISLELDKNGIVHNYVVNYGDYIMRVGLKKLEKIEPVNC